jgi:hypothetical protein
VIWGVGERISTFKVLRDRYHSDEVIWGAGERVSTFKFSRFSETDITVIK